MKRLILAILPILFAAQIPLQAQHFVPSDWKRTFDFGVKWTSLLVNSFSAGANDESKDDLVPEGIVTTTVAMTVIPEPAEFQIAIERQICQAQIQIAQRAKDAARIEKDLDRRLRTLQIKVRTIQL